MTHFRHWTETWVYVTVTHRMGSVLALPVPLAEKDVGQTVSFAEGAGISGVAEVHHLVDGEERLVAPLLSLSEFLRRSRRVNFCLPSTKATRIVLCDLTFTMSISISKSVSRSCTSRLNTTSSAFCTENLLFGSGAAIMDPWPAPKRPLQATST